MLAWPRTAYPGFQTSDAYSSNDPTIEQYTLFRACRDRWIRNESSTHERKAHFLQSAFATTQSIRSLKLNLERKRTPRSLICVIRISLSYNCNMKRSLLLLNLKWHCFTDLDLISVSTLLEKDVWMCHTWPLYKWIIAISSTHFFISYYLHIITIN